MTSLTIDFEINIEINTVKNIDSVENLSARSEKFEVKIDDGHVTTEVLLSRSSER